MAAKFSYLNGSIQNFGDVPGLGQCFHRSVALVMDRPDSLLAIGTIAPASAEIRATTPNAATEPFLHAWVEIGEKIASPASIEMLGGLYAFPRLEYYSSNGITDIHRIKRAHVMRFARDGHLAAFYKHGRPHHLGEKLGIALLRRFGIPFATDGGSAVPPPSGINRQHLPDHDRA